MARIHTRTGYTDARRPIETAVNDARSLLNIRSETEDYLVPFALMFLEKAERQFAQAKTLIQIL